MTVVRGNTQTVTANGAPGAVTKPTGLADGDVLITTMGTSAASGTPPSGFTTIGSATTSASERVTVAYKVVTSAAGEPASYTWTGASGRSSVAITAYSGVDNTTPIDMAAATATGTASVALSNTTVTANAMLYAAAIGDWSTAGMTVPTGMSEVFNLGNPGRRTAGADLIQASAGATGTQTFTGSSGLSMAGIIFALRPSSGPPGSYSGTAAIAATGSITATPAATPVLDQRMVGIGRVKVKTTDAASVRLKIGTDTGVTTGVTFTSAQTPDAQGYTTHDVSGLAAGSTFYYRVAMTNGSEILDTAGTVGRIVTAKTSGGFAFCFGSCSDGDSAAMAAIAARADDLFLHLGDFVYADGSGTSLANFRSQWDSGLARTNHAAVFATTPSTFGPSDHDGMQNNWVGTGDTTARDNYNAVVREKTAQVPVPATTGTYFSFEWGPVCFIVTDGRSFKSANAATDDSSKTVLGATQKQWVKDTAAATTKRVIIIVGDVPLTGAANVDDDEWNNYDTERQDLFGYLNGLAPTKKVAYIHGDMHAVAADDGTNSGITPGVPSFCGAPLHQAFSIKAGPYTAGTYPSSGTVDQYGRIVVSETATSVTLDYTGYSSDNTARITQTTVFDFPLSGTATQAATSSVTATGAVGKLATAAVAATVAIAAAGVVGTSAGATLTETATTSAVGVVATTGSSTLAATGAITAAGQVGTSATAARASTASVTAAGVVGRATTSALAATGSITAAGTVVAGLSASANLAATGTIAAAGTTEAAGLTGTSSLASTDTVTAAGAVGTSASSSVTASDTLAAAGVVGQATSSSLTATGAIAAAGVVGRVAAATLAETAGVTAAGATTVQGSGAAALATTGTLTAAGQVARTSIASITATAQLLATGQLATSRTTTLAATAAITANGILGELQTPPERTLVVEAEARLYEVHTETRTLEA